jgi:hypothetical protein
MLGEAFCSPSPGNVVLYESFSNPSHTCTFTWPHSDGGGRLGP